MTLEAKAHRSEKRLNAGERLVKDEMATIAELAEESPLSPESKAELEAARQAAEQALANYHNCARQKMIDSGITPQSGGQDK